MATSGFLGLKKNGSNDIVDMLSGNLHMGHFQSLSFGFCMIRNSGMSKHCECMQLTPRPGHEIGTKLKGQMYDTGVGSSTGDENGLLLMMFFTISLTLTKFPFMMIGGYPSFLRDSLSLNSAYVTLLSTD